MSAATKDGSPAAPDGRVRRSERSREAIVVAIMDLVGKGVPLPTAEQVAEHAGVGIRTVFRHFSDMESLFAAMDARLQVEAQPLLGADPPRGDLASRVAALVQHRAAFFERIAPYKRSGNLIRWRSEFLQGQHMALVRELRSDLLRRLPELERAEPELREALDLATSFEAWDRLRSEQRLGRTRAAETMECAVAALARELG